MLWSILIIKEISIRLRSRRNAILKECFKSQGNEISNVIQLTDEKAKTVNESITSLNIFQNESKKISAWLIFA